jgi:DNA polymerase III delta prime subunit
MDKFIIVKKINRKGEECSETLKQREQFSLQNKSILHKYMPKTIDEFQFPANLKTLLHKMVSLNILFVGNSGTGKTTLLKIMVREYFADISNFDENVLYINSLTDNGINYYRNEVKTFCSISSKIANKKKIVVIDDMDIIVNEQCQQILRNYIDKYDNNVIFFASCSNNQRIIDTIQSRLNIIRLVPIDSHGIKYIFTKVRENEAIDIENDATDFVITMCNNSVSMLLNYMEKFKLIGEKITINVAKSACSIISYSDFEEFTKIVFNSPYSIENFSTSKSMLDDMISKGYSVVDILDNYFNYIKNSAIIDEDTKYKAIPIITKYIVYFSNYHEDDIELYFFTADLYDVVVSKKMHF